MPPVRAEHVCNRQAMLIASSSGLASDFDEIFVDSQGAWILSLHVEQGVTLCESEAGLIRSEP